MRHFDVVVLLLAHGADPNGDEVMWVGAGLSTPEILQLLIDAGGDLHWESHGVPPLFKAIQRGNTEAVVLLLAQPLLELSTTWQDWVAAKYARNRDEDAIAALIVQEVR